MEVNLAGSEPLNATLRSLSQRRAQGILEVKIVNSVIDAKCIKLHFSLGKIVEVENSEESPIEQLRDRLCKSGLIRDLGDVQLSNYQSLYQAIRDSGSGISEEFFIDAVMHQMLDKLYLLDLSSTAHQFKVQMATPEDKFVTPLSVGEVLLDIVALESEDEIFFNTFPAEAVITAVVDSVDSLSAEESFLLQQIGVGTTWPHLRVRSILSEYKLRSVLSSLLDRGCIEIEQERGSDSLKHEENSQSLFAALESSIDQAFDLDPLVELPSDRPERSKLKPLGKSGVAVRNNPALSGVDIGYVPPVANEKINGWNAKLQQTNVIPHLIGWTLFFAASILPAILWSDTWHLFGQP